MVIKLIKKLNPKFIFKVGLGTFSCFASSEKAYALPIRAEIENGAGCNLRCEMCPINKMKRKKGFLSFDNFKKIYDQINPPYLNLTGYTESFLNKDIFKMIAYGKNKGSFIKLDSNATILKDKIISEIIKSGADAISISVDGSTEKTYGNIRKGGKLKNVLENLKRLINEKDKQNSEMQIDIAIVVQKNNINDIVNIIKLLDKLGTDHINPTPVVEYDIKEYEKFTLKNYIEELKKLIQDISKLKTKTKINYDSLKQYLKDYDEKNIKYQTESCFVPWYNTYITWEGDVVPCCYHYDNQVKFGNVFEENFKKIWNNKKYKKFRKNMIQNGRTSTICQTCRNKEDFLDNKFKMINKIPLIKKLTYRNYGK